MKKVKPQVHLYQWLLNFQMFSPFSTKAFKTRLLTKPGRSDFSYAHLKLALTKHAIQQKQK